MGVRVWGVVEDRLIEVRVRAAQPEAGMSIEGLPEGRARTTADRVRAALVNPGIVSEAPAVAIRLEPAVLGGRTSELDLTIALATLAHDGRLGAGLRWIFATGRLGLDGSVFAEDLEERASIVRFVTALDGRGNLHSEHMFEDAR